jgi:hypothetical protein
MWSKVRMAPMLYDWERIKDAAETEQILTPT